MPVKKCTTNEKPGRKWGDSGKCYPCTKKGDGWDCSAATKKALAQGIAMGEIEVNKTEVPEIADKVEDYFIKTFWQGL